MTAPAILSVQDAMVRFEKTALFEDLTFHIHPNEHIALVGKNGAGKSTLMKVITGVRELDDGKRFAAPNIRIGYLEQEVAADANQNVLEFVLSGLPEKQRDEEHIYKAEMVISPLDLIPTKRVGDLSGGQMRRAALTRALVEEPDILLLDEPTNHLDIAGIEWLEDYLRSYRGSLLCISHDKTFLKNISNKIFWLDRGRVRVCPEGFAAFEEWSQMLLDQEARELERRGKLLSQEVEWASRGVRARRKRNVRRLELMKSEREALRKDQHLFNQTLRKIELEPPTAAVASRIVAEFFKVSHHYERDGIKTPILNQLSLRVLRGDRIGLLGRNGSGKSSFIKLLLGQISPVSGKVKRAPNLKVSYFDQHRSDLKLDESLWKNLCPHGDYVDVNGKPRHVCGYLKDFMFDPKYARDPVSTLSGGQKNRLMLAKVLANPGDILILDEPTNDLDMDTLDMLEELISNYKGTLIVVSHDRDFLDQTVSKLLAFEGDGVIEAVIGGYEDYLRQCKGILPKEDKKPEAQKPEKKEAPLPEPKTAKSKISYKLTYEYQQLPERIKALEAKSAECQALLNDASLYMRDPELFDKTSRTLERAKAELEEAELRWLELDELHQSQSA